MVKNTLTHPKSTQLPARDKYSTCAVHEVGLLTCPTAMDTRASWMGGQCPI